MPMNPLKKTMNTRGRPRCECPILVENVLMMLSVICDVAAGNEYVPLWDDDQWAAAVLRDLDLLCGDDDDDDGCDGAFSCLI